MSNGGPLALPLPTEEAESDASDSDSDCSSDSSDDLDDVCAHLGESLSCREQPVGPRLTRGAGVCSTGSQEEEIVLAAAHQQRLSAAAAILLLSQEGESFEKRIPPFSWAEHVARLTEGEFKLRYRVTADSFYKLLEILRPDS